MLSTTLRALLAATGLIALGFGVAAPAGADPADCPLSFAFMCRMLPIAPDLDQDIDLTQESGTIGGRPVPQMPSADQPADLPAPDPCAGGCI